jgi:hypothetical protein
MDNHVKNPIKGTVGFFDSADELLQAANKARESGLVDFEVFSPFPIHGMDHAQRLSRSVLPFIVLGAGLTGLICGFALSYLTSVVAWPISVGGKPMNSWQAFIPVIFECTILFSAFGNLFGLLILGRLPEFNKKPIDKDLTTDRFGLLMSVSEKQPLPAHHQFFEDVHAKDVRSIDQGA